LEDYFKTWFRIHRVLCSGCNKTHALIPDFLFPFKHYPAVVLETFCQARSNGTPIDMISDIEPSIETLRLWAKALNEFCSMAGAALLRRYSTLLADFLYINGSTSHPYMYLKNILCNLPSIDSCGFVLTDSIIWNLQPP